MEADARRPLAVALTANLRNPNLRRLQLAWAGSITGYWCANVGLAVLAYQINGAVGLGWMGAARFLAPSLMGPAAGAVSDRFARRSVMVVADIGGALCLVLIALVSQTRASVGLYVLAAVMSAFQATFRPAQAALLPSLAGERKELEAANLISTTLEGIGIFVGPGLGGLILGLLGPGPLFFAAAATFVWSATLIALINARPDLLQPDAGKMSEFILDGVRTIVRQAGLRVVVAVYAAQTLIAGAMQTLLVVLAFQQLHTGAAGVGLLLSSAGLGALVGGAVTVLALRAAVARVLVLGIVLCGFPLVLVGLAPINPVALAAMLAVGIGFTMVDVAAVTLLQRLTPDRVRARVFGVLESVLMATFGVGAAVTPLLITLVSLRGALLLTGLFLPVVAAALWGALGAVTQKSGDEPVAS